MAGGWQCVRKIDLFQNKYCKLLQCPKAGWDLGTQEFKSWTFLLYFLKSVLPINWSIWSFVYVYCRAAKWGITRLIYLQEMKMGMLCHFKLLKYWMICFIIEMLLLFLSLKMRIGKNIVLCYWNNLAFNT